jgi:hypothetical protein
VFGASVVQKVFQLKRISVGEGLRLSLTFIFRLLPIPTLSRFVRRGFSPLSTQWRGFRGEVRVRAGQ